ncbi:MAG: lamin tail domain-containing protein [Sedimentisphaerales bacterium]|nr:lamin tail domain-containing protein [Sedimentisphaerales bacterium]
MYVKISLLMLSLLTSSVDAQPFFLINDEATIVINEIMYHPYHSVPGSEEIREEYIELFNRSAKAVNLAGWRFRNGVDFIFPNVTIGAGEYLVVAADLNWAVVKYGGISNIVGDWDGKLSNSGDTIELVNDSGVIVDSVHYADQGDWGTRELGPADRGHRGWIWISHHDGRGKSLELMNPALPNEYGQNWTASNRDGGTPGRINSMAYSDIAPLIVDATHFPVIPKADESVAITARIIDEQSTGMTVTVHYRVDTSVYENEDIYPEYDPDSYMHVLMVDDGANRDGQAGDGVYGATIPPHPDGTIIEFYIEATDAATHLRTWPGPSLLDGRWQQVTNALYQVNDSFDGDTHWTPGTQPIYFLIMTETDKGRLFDIGDSEGSEYYSDAQVNTTFVSVDGVDIKVRHNLGVRNRGHGSRDDPPNNYRLNFPHDRPWKNVTAVNLNTKYTYNQIAGSAIFRMSGLPQPEATAVQVRINGENLAVTGYGMYDSYVHIEVMDSDYARNHFPDDPAGNAYKCMRDLGPADFRYRGTNPDDYRNSYFKRTNTAEDDWSDLIELCYVLSDTPDDLYVEEVSRVINIDQWLRFLAINALLDNNETSLSNGYGDDYYLYRGVDDPRFVLIQHDLDTIFGRSGSVTSGIFRSTALPTLNRFLRHPLFVRRYYFHLRDLIETTFSAEQLGPFLDRLLGDFVPADVIDDMMDFTAARNQYVLSLIPSELTVESTLPQFNGYYESIRGSFELFGTADAIETESVLVNGQLAEFSPVDGIWEYTGTDILNPGVNRIIVQTFDDSQSTGTELEREHIDIWYDDGDVLEIFGALSSDMMLDAKSGPWYVTDDLTVSFGTTLSIEPGTTVFFDNSACIIVDPGGRLVAQGTEYERIRLTRVPDNGSRWNGIWFDQTLEENQLSYVDMEYGDGLAQMIKVDRARLTIDHMTWTQTDKNVLDIVHPHLIVQNSVFPNQENEEAIYGHGLSGDEYLIIEGNTFGRPSGYQDVIDFADCHLPGPIIEIYNNTFLGGEDDGIDLDNADAYIEGNVFTNFLGGSGTGTPNAIAADQGSRIIVARNIFHHNINAVLLKGHAEMLAENNTFVGQVGSAVHFSESGSSFGQGADMDGNIFWNNMDTFQNVDEQVNLTINHSILPTQWHDLGEGNIDADPLFVDPITDFHLIPGSPAIGMGPYGLDMGAYVPAGAVIDSEPDALTYRTDATLIVGGPGITHYRYRVNGMLWSDEYSVDVPIQFLQLSNDQSYTIEVIGKNAAGLWQSEDNPTVSQTWTIDTSYTRLVINEVLAINNSAFEHEGTFPDLIELYYEGPTTLNLSGMSISDNPDDPTRFVFPVGTTIEPENYLVLYADDMTNSPGIHLGFALEGNGESLYLYDRDGTLLDSVEFGMQLPDLSIGRIGYERQWRLTVPTFGGANIVQPLGDTRTLKINEWLVDGLVLFEDDFIELYNPHSAPVELSELYLTDNAITQPQKSRLGPLSFIAGEGFASFIADGDNRPGHVDFKLSHDGEMISLVDADLREIDKVLFKPQTTDVSSGRVPDGTGNFEFLELPTPGITNPISGPDSVNITILIPEVADKYVFVPTEDIGQAWTEPDFDDSAWSLCTGSPGGVGYERSTGYQDLLSLDLQEQMYDQSSTCYIRIPFLMDADTLAGLKKLTLKIRYDDGFIAYLNGVEATRANFSDEPAWNSRADASRSDSSAIVFEHIDLSNFISALEPGDNILAIHGLNRSQTSSDLLISAELEAEIAIHDHSGLEFAKALELRAGLRITELMYHAAEGSKYDYIELMNIGETMLNLSGVRLTEGIDFLFPEMTLDAGRHIVVVSDTAAFLSAYGSNVPVAGEYSGNLSNGGEKIVLQLPHPFEAAILRFEYNDSWNPNTDGEGYALAITDPGAHPAAWNWAESWSSVLPSPGR